MPKLKKKTLWLFVKLVFFAAICAMIVACESLSGISTQGAIKDGKFCDLYEPVYTVPSDSEKTKEQVDNNNVLYEEC